MRIVAANIAFRFAVRIALAFAVMLPVQVEAAVRSCGPIVSSDIVSAATENGAKKIALDQWRAAALKRGPGYDSWRLAASKSLKCFPKDAAKGGGYDCVAFGAPCIVDQSPATPPRANPFAKGHGI